MRLYIDRSFKFRKFNTLLFASMRYNLWCNLINIRPVKPLLHGKLRLNSLSYSRHVHKAILELWCVLSTFLSTFYLFTCFLSCTFILTLIWANRTELSPLSPLLHLHKKKFNFLQISLLVKGEVRDDNGKDIMCFVFPAQIKPKD